MTGPLDLASPEQCARRQERMALAATARAIRNTALSDAMAEFRKHGIQTADEFVAALQNLTASIQSSGPTDLNAMKEQVTNLICDWETEGQEPELQAFGPRGEYDAFTPRRSA